MNRLAVTTLSLMAALALGVVITLGLIGASMSSTQPSVVNYERTANEPSATNGPQSTLATPSGLSSTLVSPSTSMKTSTTSGAPGSETPVASGPPSSQAEPSTSEQQAAPPTTTTTPYVQKPHTSHPTPILIPKKPTTSIIAIP